MNGRDVSFSEKVEGVVVAVECKREVPFCTGSDPVPHPEARDCNSQVCDACTHRRELSGKVLAGSVQFSGSVVSDSLQPRGLQHTRLPCPSPSPGSLLNLMPIELVILSNHLILCHPLLLLPSIFPSIRLFSNESALHIRWPKYSTIALQIL